jgi:hypothetical protein
MKQPSCHGKGTISYPNELKAAIWGELKKKKKKKKKKRKIHYDFRKLAPIVVVIMYSNKKLIFIFIDTESSR